MPGDENRTRDRFLSLDKFKVSTYLVMKIEPGTGVCP